MHRVFLYSQNYFVVLSRDVQGSAFCSPENSTTGPFLPHLALVVQDEGVLKLNILTVLEPETGTVALGEEVTSEILPTGDFEGPNLEPPTLAMGVFPDAMVCSLGNIVVVLLRGKGAMVAYELKNSGLHVIVKEDIGHYIIDAVMRYSAIEGGAEVVMLLSDNDNHKDGRIASFYFRSTV